MFFCDSEQIMAYITATSQLVTQSRRHTVTSSHGHLVTRSRRHTVNSSPVNSSHKHFVTQSTRHNRTHRSNKATSHNFWATVCKTFALCYRFVVCRRRPHCIRWVPSAPRKGHSTPPPLGPCLLWPRSPISATAELLFYLHAGQVAPRNSA